MFLVRHGRLIEQRRVSLEQDVFQAELRALVERAQALPAPPKRVGKEEVDQINIIARWIQRHSEEHERAFFPLPVEMRAAEQIEQFVARVALAVAQKELSSEEAVPSIPNQENPPCQA